MMALALLLSLQTDSSGLRWSEVDGQYLISADIVGADPRKLFGEIATRSGRKLVGIEHLPATLPITLAFTDRPLSWVTQAVAGSVGWHVQLRSDRIELSVDDLSRLSESELENRLQAACLRALRNDGQNADAPRAELALGTIEERRGNVQAALGHFQSAVERDPDGELAPQALMHAGAAHIRLSQHVQAIECFTRVVGHTHTGAEQAEARLQLTRAIALNGDGRQALFLLDSLDQQSPAANDDERQTREYVRALACLKAERRAEALEALARAENTGASPEWARTAHELRAEVLAHFGRNRDAALAWLVGVLMIQGLAKDSTAATALAPMAELARKRLGLSKHSDGAAGDLLEIAWRAMERGQPSKALAALEQAYPLREQREPEARLDLVLLYARALGANQQVDRALDVLRLEGSGVTDAAVLGRLCFMAGSLLEAAGRHEEAFAAFGGKL
jgi:tetratricopeptide (TPR) repeat protein